MTRPATITEAMIRRAVKGATEGGFVVGLVEIAPDGTIRMLPGGAETAKREDDPFSAWKAKREGQVARRP